MLHKVAKTKRWFSSMLHKVAKMKRWFSSMMHRVAKIAGDEAGREKVRKKRAEGSALLMSVITDVFLEVLYVAGGDAVQRLALHGDVTDLHVLVALERDRGDAVAVKVGT